MGVEGGPPSATSTAALELRGRTKRFGATVAVAGIDLLVSRGSSFGLVGPNGTGKTTAHSMVFGLLRPERGEARIFGVDI